MARQLILLAVLLVLGVVHQTFADEPERVVGGTNASPGQFPYQVSLRIRRVNHFCGGTLVGNKYVVTAAHCIHGTVSAPWRDLTVVSGTISTASGGQSHTVQNVILHPNYVHSMAQSYVNDIAVIVLSAPYAQNQYQRPISIATGEIPANAPLTLSGWGNLSARGPLATILQRATVYYMPNQQCQAANAQYRIYDTQLCTRSQVGIGACQGDSGGPLVYNGQLAGVVSWVYPCALGKPDVYTKASRYVNFVNEVMRRY